MILGLPIALIFFPIGVGMLIYAYRQRSKAKRVIVGTTFLLAQFAQTAARRSKVKIPPRFWLEVLILSLLVGVLAKASLPRIQKKVAIVIDNSLSSSAKLPNSSSILDAILEEARSKVSELRTSSSFSIFTSTDSTLIAEGNENSTLPAISKIQVVHKPENLEQILSEIHINEFDSIYVFTDRVLSTPSKSISVITIPKQGQELPNLAVEKVIIDPASKALVTLRNFSTGIYKGELLLKEVKGGSKRTLIKDRFSIEPKSSKVFPLEINAQATEAIEASVLPETLDVLEADNFTQARILHDGNSIGVLGDVSLELLNLRGVSGYSFEKIDSVSKLQDNSTIIAYKTDSETFRANTLYVLPREINEIAEDIRIVSWEEKHPILRYLALINFNISSAGILKPKPWQESVIQSTKGSILLAGEKNGFRYVVSGIELFPFEGKKSATLSVLTLNILKWLSTQSTPPVNDNRFLEHESDFGNRDTTIKSFESSISIEHKEVSSFISGILLWIILGLIFLDLFYLLLKKTLLGGIAR